MTDLSLEQPVSGVEEAQRMKLVLRCNDATGNTAPILAEVLSYFPKQAELFIHTQNYASQVTGEKKVWGIIWHKKPSNGVDGNGHYNTGDAEHLWDHGYIAEDERQVIDEIQNFRGDRASDVYYSTPEAVEALLKVANQDRQKDEGAKEQIIRKIIEVMKVTSEEISLLSEYDRSHKKAKLNYGQAEQMRRQAEELQQQGDEMLQCIRKKVANKYPKKPRPYIR